MNRFIIVGNLTKDPEEGATPNGIAVSHFSVAVSRRYANADGEREVDFFPVNVFSKLAENCNRYLTKGKKVAVAGSVHLRRYTDKDGIKRQAIEVVADEVEFLSARTDDTQAEMPPKPTKRAELEDVTNDDNLPF